MHAISGSRTLTGVTGSRCPGGPPFAVHSGSVRQVQHRRPLLRAAPHNAKRRDNAQTHQIITDGLNRLEKADKELVARDAEYDALADSIRDLSGEVRDKLGGTSIYLVGMMGSGKSTIGKLLAAALKYYFFDSDTVVEKHTGSAISEIFATEGEDAFREVETAVLKELAPFRSCVVAAGGGAVIRRVNWGHMNHAISVFLDGAPPLLAARLVADGTDSRPLVAAREGGEGESEYARTLQRLEGMMDERARHYELADLRVPLAKDLHGGDANLGAAAAVVTQRILQQLKQRLDEKAEELETKRTATSVIQDDKTAIAPEE